jgi:hypothetical protein
MSESTAKLAAGIDTVQDIKHTCIPLAHEYVQQANEHVAQSLRAIDALVVAGGGS